MVTATFHFHAELNDFLPPARRARPFAAPCARAATAKHMIEALGVPHTEVGRVLVNGEPSPLGRLLRDADSVEVYPPAQPAVFPGRPRFIADAHLGGLARLLRMAGFDTLYDNNYEDGAIVAAAAAEQRMVLTRDRALLMRREVEHGCYVRALKPEQQLREMMRRLDLAASARPFSLCLSCNAPLRPVAKAQVEESLPPSVRAAHTDFLTCDVCHGVFWRGSHWRRMQALLASVGAL